MKRSFRISRPASKDLKTFLAYSQSRFGERAADNYQSLLVRAFGMIRSDPDACSSRTYVGVPTTLGAFHLKSVPQSPRSVARPRHLIVFQVRDESVEIVRVLHERMDRRRHLR